MKKVISVIIALIAFAYLIPSYAGAETKKLRLYSYITEMHVMPIDIAKAPANFIVERRGFAEYEDGEVATYLMRGAGKLTPKGGEAEGFSQFSFDDGATIVVKWQAKFDKKEGDKLMSVSGQGAYVSGTSRFEGIQGDVTFAGKYVTPYSEEKGTLGDLIIDVTANYTVPTK